MAETTAAVGQTVGLIQGVLDLVVVIYKGTVNGVKDLNRTRHQDEVKGDELIVTIMQYVDKHATAVTNRQTIVAGASSVIVPSYGVYEIRTRTREGRDYTINVKYEADKVTLFMREYHIPQALIGNAAPSKWFTALWHRIIDPWSEQPSSPQINPTGTLPPFGGAYRNETSRYHKHIKHFLTQFMTKEQAALMLTGTSSGQQDAQLIMYAVVSDKWAFAPSSTVGYDTARCTRENWDFLDDVGRFIRDGPTPGEAYTRKYLLIGPPSTGKTKMSGIVATQHGLPIYRIPVASGEMGGHLFQTLMGTAGRNLEDLVTASGHKLNSKKNYVIVLDEFGQAVDDILSGRNTKMSVGDLLTALGGDLPLASGAIVIMTTNSDTFLRDPRLIGMSEPSRINKRFDFRTRVPPVAPVSDHDLL